MAIQLVRCLWNFTVVAPCAIVGRRYDWRYRCVLLRNHEATGKLKQVGVLWVTCIKLISIALMYSELAKQDCLRFCLVFIAQQPGIIAFSGSRAGEAMQINLHLIINSLAAVFTKLFAAQEGDVPYKPHYRRSSRCERKHTKKREIRNHARTDQYEERYDKQRCWKAPSPTSRLGHKQRWAFVSRGGVYPHPCPFGRDLLYRGKSGR